MKIDLVFILLLTGHILGDFYFQTEKMAAEKATKGRALLFHCFVYALVMDGMLFMGIPLSGGTWWLALGAGACHMAIDGLKFLYLNQRRWTGPPWLGRHLFSLDQCLHLVSLAALWWLFGVTLPVRWFVSQEMDHLPALPVTLLLGVLCILRPVGLFIGKGELWEAFGTPPNPAVPPNTKNAGRTIGYLERLIVFLLLLYQQFTAIAFVLTAKSVARFKDIEQDRTLAEYYLIGTLLSVACVLVISFLLGLTGNGA